ncbi:F-box/kelch-repeat protein At3g06240-like [Rutidosis leptorrhynchoides]|uniref:F-box/kelch-repeat protein At3g06240-like n=1 Tax=Rutidosis leptorrhynchoides TaxID=125765 RepID=UPI003A98E386
MTWLPAKSLIRFRSVSKKWNSLISSSKFKADYTTRHALLQNLLICNSQSSTVRGWEGLLVSMVDDDTFSEQLYVTTPESLELKELQIVGSSHGLLCFVGVPGFGFDRLKYTPNDVVIWNPSINNFVSIFMLNVKKGCLHGQYSFIGFGVCPNTLDPKIVKFLTCKCRCNVDVEVFTLSSRVWRSPLSNTIMLRKNIDFTYPYNNVVIDGFIYWFVFERRERINMIVSFNLTNEEFTEIQLSDEIQLSLKWSYHIDSRIFKFKESLAVVLQKAPQEDFEVWKMEINGVTRSFTRLFNIEIPDLSVIKLCGFNKNGQLILEMDNHGSRDLVAYEPYTKRINNLVNNGRSGSFMVTSYTESLLLCDRYPTKLGLTRLDPFKKADPLLGRKWTPNIHRRQR